jgi:molybdopterin/thiamine biosynthesis adenylyltransferase/rhodanese-related sulfurtransferase
MALEKSLSALESSRYARHFVIPEIGREGQIRLKSSSALIVGVGGLGSPAALYLAAAGVGRLGLVDFDRVDRSNLHRQILHFDSDVGKPKLQSAFEKIHALNPFVEVSRYETPLSSENALEILSDYDVILDGTDNFATRYLVNDACVLLDKPNVHASIFRFEGQASVFWKGHGPCYRCLFPSPPPYGSVPNCAEAGVLGVLPGIMGSIQAVEAIKILLGIGQPLLGELLLFDALSMDFRKLHVSRNSECAVCGDSPIIHKLIDYETFCNVKKTDQIPSVSVHELADRLKNGANFVLLDVREQDELEISRLDPCEHIPMDDIEKQIDRLHPGDEIFVLCRTGRRSALVAELLISKGFIHAKNVEGGINAYAREVDNRLQEY